MTGIIAVVLWMSAIFAPDGSYTGSSYVTDNQQECQSAVQFARGRVPEGFTVADCASVFGPASAPLEQGTQAP